MTHCSSSYFSSTWNLLSVPFNFLKEHRIHSFFFTFKWAPKRNLEVSSFKKTRFIRTSSLKRDTSVCLCGFPSVLCNVVISFALRNVAKFSRVKVQVLFLASSVSLFFITENEITPEQNMHDFLKGMWTQKTNFLNGKCVSLTVRQVCMYCSGFKDS